MADAVGSEHGRAGQGASAARRGAQWPRGWLLVEMPSALLLAVFVGTGWLGYARHDQPSAPAPTVVSPTDRPDAWTRIIGPP
ncbi:hypothetical protein [Nocardia sp. alder85J]|uniref:hypothetical protein n=1 Tax=Nocardia sp. alder85J TaxID=2862949 RepID=UPI001CD24B44|nr:hypothetical protein [Nocardia sp. alder85J]MCX4092722.1 hypothetical protein [Nocardia sp. alder85J]